MNRLKMPLWGVLTVLAVLVVFAVASPAEAQDPTKFLAQTKETAKQGWGLLTTIGSVVIGGGALISLAAGMYQGRWGRPRSASWPGRRGSSPSGGSARSSASNFLPAF